MVTRQILNACCPIQSKRIVEEFDEATFKLIRTTNMVNGNDYKEGFYVNRPGVMRGEERLK